jgi:hypothetical protein
MNGRLAMKICSPWLLACLLPLPFPAAAWCFQNDLKDREIYVEQERIKNYLREDQEFKHTFKPGEKQCCFNLNCNPGGRPESTVNITVRVLGDPAYICGAPEGSSTIKVAGNGTVRVVNNPRGAKSAFPYAIKIRSNDREAFGPNGLQCLKPKGSP